MSNNDKNKHLIVISYDAFSEDNWEMASKLPNISELMKNGAYTSKMKSVFPTLTYVAHSTLVTGVYPDKHKIFQNNAFQPFVEEKNQNWFWYRKDIKVPTIYDVARQSGLTTAGLLWPVTGKAKIKYNLPEVVAINNENQGLKILKNGSPFFCIRLALKYGKIRKGVGQPYLDDFTTACAVDVIKRKKPNLLLVHLIDLDDAKHYTGINSEQVKQVILRMDKRIGDIMSAVDEAGIKDETVLLIVGDHGQKAIRYKIYLNKLLKDNGLIYEEKGQLKWRAYVQGAGGSAGIFIKEEDKEAEVLVKELLDKAVKQNSYGIKKIYSDDERIMYHMDTKPKYIIEAKIGYSFHEEIGDEIIRDLSTDRIAYGNHGYSPDIDDYKCNFLIAGKYIKNGLEIGDINMVDVAPTIARILGLTLNNCDGRVIEEVFSD